MSETIINDLPTEIIIAILRKVDRKSLKNAALTCKLWKELIESSCPFSLLLNHLNEDSGDDEPWMDFLLTTNRKFYKFKLDGLVTLGKNRIIDIFTKHGTHISKLFVFNSSLDRIDQFVDVLICMPNLEHLIFYRTTTQRTVVDVPSEDKLPEMLRLKTVELVESDAVIIKCLKRAKLSDFKLLSCEKQPMTHQEPVQELLRTQSQLKTLALRSISDETSTLFQTDVLDGSDKFQLSKLSLLDIKLRESPNDYNNLLKFLKPQAKTIKSLELGRAFPDLVYEFVFAKFKNLNCLRLMVNELPKDMEFYERLGENQSITQLIFMDSPPPNHLTDGCPPSLKEFIRHVPNVTDLTLLDYCDRGTLQFISTNLANLKRLAVIYFNQSIFGGLQFPNLVTLCVQQIEDDVDWDVFTKCNPDITELIINTGTFAGFSDWPDESRNHLIEKVTQNLRLQTLRIGSHFPANEHFYEMIRDYGTDLKVVDLHRKCALGSDMMNGIPGLRFHEDDLFGNLRDSTKHWNEDDYDGNLPDIDRGGNWDNGENLDPFDPFDMHWMDIDDYDEYDQQDDFDDDYDDFVDDLDEHSDYDDK